MTQQDTFWIGPHAVTRESDVIRLCYRGSVSLAEVQAILLRIDQLMTERGPGYLLADLREVGMTSPAARRHMVEWARSCQLLGCATIAGSAVVRGAITLLYNAARLLGARAIPLCSAPTEAAALQWIDAHRSRAALP